jgi:hypothetical protein
MTSLTPTGDWLGSALAVALVFFIMAAIGLSNLAKPLKLLLFGALALRLVGATLRYIVNFEYYGTGDALQYHAWGLQYAEHFARFDFSPIFDSSYWFREAWYGTQFIVFPTGLIAAAIGPSLYAQFVLYSLFSFVGLVGFVIAFRRSFPEVRLRSYALWIFLLPSLWYWPSSLGKDALVLMGLGVAVWGYVGYRGRVNWYLLGLGLLLIFAIRPQVLMVVIFSMLVGHWLTFRKLNAAAVLQGVVLLALGAVGFWFAMVKLGIEEVSIGAMQAYMENDASRRITKGSSVAAVPIALAGIPYALMNVLARPFLFEARNVMVLFASIEVTLFWVLVWRRRRQLVDSLWNWRSDRLLRFSVPFILLYSVAFGLMVTNMGIIARQRVPIFPFLFLLLEAVPRTGRRVRADAKQPLPAVPRVAASPPLPAPGPRRPVLQGFS